MTASGSEPAFEPASGPASASATASASAAASAPASAAACAAGHRFARDYDIRFSHCDPAGIVFFPQYLILFNHLVEDWFNDGLGISYSDMIGPRRIGLPIVRLECDFRAIARMGETLRFELAVERAGGKSLSLALRASGGGIPRVAARQVLVFTNLDIHRAIAIPDDIRAALAATYNATTDTRAVSAVSGDDANTSKDPRAASAASRDHASTHQDTGAASAAPGNQRF